MLICIFLGPNNALNLLTYTTEDVTIGKHCNSGDCWHLNVTVWAGKVPFKKAWKTLMTSGSKWKKSIKTGKKVILVFYACKNLQAIYKGLDSV